MRVRESEACVMNVCCVRNSSSERQSEKFTIARRERGKCAALSGLMISTHPVLGLSQIRRRLYVAHCLVGATCAVDPMR